MKREPVLIQAFIAQVISLGMAFGLDLDVGQVAAINSVVAAGLAIWTRSRVTPV